MIRVTTLTLLLLAACQRRHANQEGPTTCDAEFATDLSATLNRACVVEGRPATTIALATAPWSSTDPMAEAIPLAITASGVSMGMTQDAPMTLAELRPVVLGEFEKFRELKESTGDETPPRFLLLVAKDAALGRVAEVLAMLETAGHRTGAIGLASGTEPPAAPPVYPETFARLDAKLSTYADVRANQIAEIVRESVDGCEPAREAFAELARVGADERCALSAMKIPAAIVECNCEQAAELTSLIQLLFGVDTPAVEQDDVVLDRAAGITVDPTQTWGDFIAKRTTGFDRLWLTTR